VFDQRNDDGVVVVLQESLPDHDQGPALEAVEQCPTQAITIEPT
jgi:ferredoxin